MSLRKALRRAYEGGRDDGRWGRLHYPFRWVGQERDEDLYHWAYDAGYRVGVCELVAVVTKIRANQEINAVVEANMPPDPAD